MAPFVIKWTHGPLQLTGFGREDVHQLGIAWGEEFARQIFGNPRNRRKLSWVDPLGLGPLSRSDGQFTFHFLLPPLPRNSPCESV